MYVLRLWEEAGALGGNPHEHQENMQHRATLLTSSLSLSMIYVPIVNLMFALKQGWQKYSVIKSQQSP